jgi:hypothetical protein
MLAILLGVYPLTALALVGLGQPVRPVGHLFKASAFWTVVAWALLAALAVAL